MRAMGSLCLALALAVLACASMVRADEILSLDQAIAIALLDNPSVEIAGLDVDKTAEDINAARADYFPQMKATLASTRNLVEQSYTFDEGVFGTFAATGPIPAETTEIDTSSGWSNSVGLSVVQSLTGVYQVMMEVEKLSLQERMNAETLRSELQDTAKSVKQTYYQILAS